MEIIRADRVVASWACHELEVCMRNQKANTVVAFRAGFPAQHRRRQYAMPCATSFSLQYLHNSIIIGLTSFLQTFRHWWLSAFGILPQSPRQRELSAEKRCMGAWSGGRRTLPSLRLCSHGRRSVVINAGTDKEQRCRTLFRGLLFLNDRQPHLELLPRLCADQTSNTQAI